LVFIHKSTTSKAIVYDEWIRFSFYDEQQQLPTFRFDVTTVEGITNIARRPEMEIKVEVGIISM
jgi:hypothetical protein